jgi:hypothetical protein
MLMPFGAFGCFHIAHIAVAETAYLYVVGEPFFFRCRAVRAPEGRKEFFCTVLAHMRE